MPSHNTYRLTWVSLTLDMGYLFTAAPAKHSHCSLLWTRGISSQLLQSLPSYWGFSDLGHGVSLHGCSSKVQPLLLTLDEGYLLIAAPATLNVEQLLSALLRPHSHRFLDMG